MDRNGWWGHIDGSVQSFDCLAHDFTIEKLSAYGLSDTACSFLHGYLSDRKQMVKLEQNHTLRLNTIKGVSQGSKLGPLRFNIFINDIFFFVKQCTYIITQMTEKKMQKYKKKTKKKNEKKKLFLTAVRTFLRPRLWLRLRVKTLFSGLPSITCRQTLKNSGHSLGEKGL